MLDHLLFYLKDTIMNENSEPLDFILDYCEKFTNINKFVLLNAKDELKKLRLELTLFKKFVQIGCARVNNRGDYYDLRMQCNPYVDPEMMVPIYAERRLKGPLTNADDSVE